MDRQKVQDDPLSGLFDFDKPDNKSELKLFDDDSTLKHVSLKIPDRVKVSKIPSSNEEIENPKENKGEQLHLNEAKVAEPTMVIASPIVVSAASNSQIEVYVSNPSDEKKLASKDTLELNPDSSRKGLFFNESIEMGDIFGLLPPTKDSLFSAAKADVTGDDSFGDLSLSSSLLSREDDLKFSIFGTSTTKLSAQSNQDIKVSLFEPLASAKVEDFVVDTSRVESFKPILKTSKLATPSGPILNTSTSHPKKVLNTDDLNIDALNLDEYISSNSSMKGGLFD